MAGIFAIYKKNYLSNSIDEKLNDYSLKLKHRGPIHTFKYDKFPIKLLFYQKGKFSNNRYLNFFMNESLKSVVLIDGQIYNSNEINAKYSGKNNATENLEGIIAGYKKFGIKIFNELLGSFSGVLFDGHELLGFKDPIGGKPLYYCENNDIFICSSELKALAPLNLDIIPINPGTARFSSEKTEIYYKYPNFISEYEITKDLIEDHKNKLNKMIKVAVSDSIKEGENICGLLSGGLDSVIINYIAKDIVENLKVYTVGIEGSRDVIFAKKFASRYNLPHTIITITLKEMLKSLKDVIYSLETFDAALIRSSVPMFLLVKKIREEQGECILLTGEGGDELFGGYSYLLESNSNINLNQELLNLYQLEHKTGLQRVDRIPYFFSIEARAPLFDQRLVELSFKIPPELKILRKKGIGVARKWILRKAFENEIPPEFIWRKKLKFSNGAGSEFMLRNHINNIITDSEFNDEKQITSDIVLRSKEELYYWRIFEAIFKPTLGTIYDLGLTSVYDV